MEYDEARAWLYGRQSLGIKLGLDKVHKLLEAIGNPQEQFQSVHVAGTNGKGSVTIMLGAVLQRAGQRVGVFTSPHLNRFTERIQVDGQEIPEDEVARGLSLMQDAVAKLDAADTPPTFFEITTALAFWWFAKSECAWAVIETGMGGRMDATNVLQPALTIVTNVAYDHAAFLGDDIAAIAYEKAGILKPNVPCVTAARDGALVVLKSTSQSLKVPMSIIGEDYHVLPDINGMRLVHPGGEAHYDVGMAGEHQLENAAIVVAAVDALQTHVDLPASAVHQAIAEARMPGRLEMVQADIDGHAMEVLLDGAHNAAGAQALRYHLGRLDWAGFAWIVGFNEDKEWLAMLQQCMPLASRIIAVPLRTSRSLSTNILGPHVAAAGFPFETAPDVAAALNAAADAGAERVLIAGSLFLVGEARAVLLGEPLEAERDQ